MGWATNCGCEDNESGHTVSFGFSLTNESSANEDVHGGKTDCDRSGETKLGCEVLRGGTKGVAPDDRPERMRKLGDACRVAAECLMPGEDECRGSSLDMVQTTLLAKWTTLLAKWTRIFLCLIKKKMSVEQTRKRLQELLAAYPQLEQQAAEQAAGTKPIAPNPEDLISLYQAYHSWLVWHYALSQELRQLVNFNVAEDVHRFLLEHDQDPSNGTKKSSGACRTKKEKFRKMDSIPSGSKTYRNALPEPILEWLPPLLKTNGAPVSSKHYTDEEKLDAIPLWTDQRLFAYLSAVPPEMLRHHALSRGLMGGPDLDPELNQKERQLPRRDLAHGRGWFPVPTGAPWPQQVAMLFGDAPFQLTQLA